ncbi:DinB family protein [Mucilaginibacter yixingensis]|nr:DinB family protein [Mucilaginibacter yixingensis]
MIAVVASVDDFLNRIEHHQLDWDLKPAPGKWSAKEVIGHLIDSAQINLHRFVRCTYEDSFSLIYLQDEWVATQHYQTADIEDLLQLWRLLNLQIQRVLDNYPTDRWLATCNNHTVEFISHDYLAHMVHHLKSITP